LLLVERKSLRAGEDFGVRGVAEPDEEADDGGRMMELAALVCFARRVGEDLAVEVGVLDLEWCLGGVGARLVKLTLKAAR
jgi:hypothetical protein